MKKLVLVITLLAVFFQTYIAVAGSEKEEAVWIDVRSAAEYMLDHIEGDTRIAHSSIVEEVADLYPDKDTEIRVYCRSGGRAEKAKSALESAGYTHVTNVGGIDDARKLRSISP